MISKLSSMLSMFPIKVASSHQILSGSNVSMIFRDTRVTLSLWILSPVASPAMALASGAQASEMSEEKMSKMMEKLRIHGLRVKQYGHYLELIDVLLFCHKFNIKAVIYLNTESPIEQGRPIADYLCDLLGLGPHERSCFPHPSGDSPTWGIVMTRSDMKPSNNPQDWNHWIIGHQAGNASLDSRLKILDDDLATYKEQHQDVMENLHSQDEDLLDSLQTSLTQKVFKIEYYKTLTQRLYAAAQLFPVDTVGDGNCGVYALVALQSPQQFVESVCVAQTDEAEMMAMREDLSTLWLDLSEATDINAAIIWARLFEHLVDGVGVNPQESEHPGADTSDTAHQDHEVHEASASAAEQIAPTTPKKPKSDQAAHAPLLPEFPDFTPPRVSATARRRPGAGILCERPSSGPSVPLKKDFSNDVPSGSSGKQIKQEPGTTSLKQKVTIKQEGEGRGFWWFWWSWHSWRTCPSRGRRGGFGWSCSSRSSSCISRTIQADEEDEEEPAQEEGYERVVQGMTGIKFQEPRYPNCLIYAICAH